MKSKRNFSRLSALTLVLLAATMTVVFASKTAVADEPSTASDSASAEAEPKYTPKTEAELRRTLSRIQFQVTQEESTEPAFRNKYWNNKKEGDYFCIVCNRKLFKSDTKYKSGTGWPSFFAPVDKKVVGYRIDNYLVYARTEVHCSRCDAHLGHVFNDGPAPTGKRYCMNSASLKFVEKSDKTPATETTDKTPGKAVEQK